LVPDYTTKDACRSHARQSGSAADFGVVLGFLHIFFFCRDVLAPRVRREAPSTSQAVSPPPSSPGDSEELMEDNQRLRIQLQQCRDVLREKIEQLWTKSELLITCQYENVKHLQALAEAMREKVEHQRRLEDSNKTIASNKIS
jgi:hypothetical protein